MMRLAVICDYAEENWPSMELVAEMLLRHLRADHASVVEATRVCPSLKHRLSRLPFLGKKSFAFNADRLINRFRDYPASLQKSRAEFDLFHLVDHSYAHLVHELPRERTIVTCHDLDTFRCVLEPSLEPRARWFVTMTGKILDGLRKAAWVTCDSFATRDELLKYEIVPASRTVVIPNGVHPSCSPDADAAADAEAVRLLGDYRPETVELLHVGSTIARKRIDVLLRVFASVGKEFPGARLVRAGGDFTAEQLKLVEQLGLSQSITVLPKLSREVLAAVYRRAALVLQPSSREGFGLPVVEALACGAPVVASELDVLREVGGEAAIYRPVADVSAWSEAVIALLSERRDEPQLWKTRRDAGLKQAARFTWSEYANKMVALYRDLWYS
jgi:glycosyltransferase involved in cell wall biosynthesis